MPFDIEQANYKTSKELIDEVVRDNFEVFQSLYKGDHWRGGEGWVGPRPNPEDLAGTPNGQKLIQDFTARVQRQFVSKNVVKEVVSRHVNGVLSRKADLQINIKQDSVEAEEITPEQQDELDLLETQFRTWMKDKKIMQTLRDALSTALYAEKAVLRFFVPTDEEGMVETPEDMEGALDKIYLDVITPDEARVFEDPDTKRKYGMYIYENTEEKDAVELTWVDPDTGLTHLRVMTGEQTDEGEPLNLHGRIYHYEIHRDPIITDQIKQLQDLLNKNLTMWSANLDWSAFTERMILNGMPPGNWELDETTREMEYKETGPMVTGPNQTNFVMGQPQFNDDGQVTGMTNPQVVFREPINVETFNNTLGSSYTSILEEAKQAHILLNAESTPSGISRREARQDYQDDLKQSKSQMDDAGEWVLETAMLLGLEILGQASDDFPYDIAFNTILQVGALTAEENEILIKQVDNKLLSPETAMRRMGVDDVDAEMKRIDRVSEHMREIIELMNEMGVSSPLLAKEIVRLMIVDKQEFFNELQDEQVLGEIEESANRQAQQSALMGAFDEPVEGEQ